MLRNHPALRHILGRAGWYFATYLVAVAINFFLPRLGEANPVDVIMSKITTSMDTKSSREKEEAYLKEFGLVQADAQGNVLHGLDGKPLKTPLVVQFVSYLGMCLRGDFGSSILQHPKRVSEIIKTSIPWTLSLQIPTIIFGWIFGNLLGALAAYKRGVFDKVFYPLALLTSGIPAFCFGILLVYIFAIQLDWFPAMGGYDSGMNPSLSWAFFQSASYYYLLPFCSIYLMVLGGQAIGMRSMCIYELGTDYVKYAKLLGMRESKIVLYMFRNAMLPQLTGLALALGGMVGGALITEIIFSYPGLGMAVLTAIQGYDYPVITGCTLLVTTCVLIANFAVDIMIVFLDPRIRTVQLGGK